MFRDDCPTCGAESFDTVDNYCWECGYDSEIESDLTEQPDPDEWTDAEDDDLD